MNRIAPTSDRKPFAYSFLPPMNRIVPKPDRKPFAYSFLPP